MENFQYIWIGMFSQCTVKFRYYDHSTIKTSFCQSHMFSNVSDKIAYANSVNPDQTGPSSLIREYTVCHSTKYSKKRVHKTKSVA